MLAVELEVWSCEGPGSGAALSLRDVMLAVADTDLLRDGCANVMKAGPGRYYSPRHTSRMPSNSINECVKKRGGQLAWQILLATLWDATQRRRTQQTKVHDAC